MGAAFASADLAHDLGVVILSYGAGPAARCATSLLRCGLDPKDMLIVHNPTPDARQPVDSPPQIELLALGSNCGYSAAMNTGMRIWRERGRRLALLCTHDVTVNGPDVRRIIETMHADEKIGACGPVLQGPDGEVFSAGGMQTRLGNVRHLSADVGGLVDVQWLDGSLIAVDLSLGLEFREDFFLYWEDVVFGAAVRAAGSRVVCERRAVATSSPGVAQRAPLFTYLMWRNRLLAQKGKAMWAIYTVARLLSAMALRFIRGPWPADTVRLVYARALRDGIMNRGGPPPQALLANTDVQLS